MKSTEASPRAGKPKGRQPNRKFKFSQKSSNASEIENHKSVSDRFTPPRTNVITPEERKQGESTPRRKKNPLANLQSNLSPKYIGFVSPTSTEKRRTKYRTAKLKDSSSTSTCYGSSHGLIGCVRRTTVSSRYKSPISSPEMSRRNTYFESPIEKLLRKNGALKSAPCSPVNDDEVPGEENFKQVENIQKNCVVRIEEMHPHEPAGLGGDRVELEVSEEINNLETANVKDPIAEKGTICTPMEVDIVNDSTVYIEGMVEDLPLINTGNVSDGISSDNEGPVNILDNNDNITKVADNPGKISIEVPATQMSPSVDSARGESPEDVNWELVETGDLCWGQIFQFSYWPCIVCPDPEGKTVILNKVGDQLQNISIHVRFFADNGRRSWVKSENLMQYTGLDAYMKKMSEAEKMHGTKNPKYKVFIVQKNKSTLWNQAVRECNIIDGISMKDRLQKFFEMLEQVRLYNNKERKRRQSMLSHSSTSDLGSMSDSTDNLYLKTKNASKRDRSPTPVSPAYSPLGQTNAEKRLKLSEYNTIHRTSNLTTLIDGTETISDGTVSSQLEGMQNDVIFSETEFKKFVTVMRSFVLENSTNEMLEKQFMLNARSMWTLKHIVNDNRIESTLETDNTPNDVKRLSQRIRNITIRKSLPSRPLNGHVQLVNEKSVLSKPRKTTVRTVKEVLDDILQLDRKYLFKGVPRDAICKECYKPGPDLFKCSKNCQAWVHSACSANSSNESLVTDVVPATFLHITGDLDESSLEKAKTVTPIVCKECNSAEPTKCFVCKSNDAALGEMARCNVQNCGKMIHANCLRYWPQARLTKSEGKLQSLRCPAHVCHTCISDNPKIKFLQIRESKLTKCIKCPATYHMDSGCIPAGSQILSTTVIICPRHSELREPLINVNWCFICVAGGDLICCETCPTTVHAVCLKIPIAEDGYICEECETGRMPLYGEIVWAKFNNFRWWPSLILAPPEVPENLAKKAHNPSEFVIRFFGTNDHAWISRRRVYLYLEDDFPGPPKSNKKGLDINYIKGVEEAKRMYIYSKEQRRLLADDRMLEISPLPYSKIKSNRAVPPIKLQVNQEKISKCECSKDSPNPCGQDSGCLNRVLLTECNPKICPAGERCQNQLFEQKVYPKLDVLYMNEKGFGLICLEPISAGTFVIEYVGEVIDDAEFRRRIAQKEEERDENFYFLTLEKDFIIDAEPRGNLARFMNHSCDPNCETQKWSVNGLNRIGLFAIKDIPVKTELTFNYFWDELLGNEKKSCHCGADKCAGLIGGKYKKPAKQPQPPQKKTKAKGRLGPNSMLKSPKKIIKLKSKEAAKKGGKRNKLTTLVNNNHISSISTTNALEEIKPNSEVPKTIPAEEKQIEDTQS